jgi:hypothetical protein
MPTVSAAIAPLQLVVPDPHRSMRRLQSHVRVRLRG